MFDKYRAESMTEQQSKNFSNNLLHSLSILCLHSRSFSQFKERRAEFWKENVAYCAKWVQVCKLSCPMQTQKADYTMGYQMAYIPCKKGSVYKLMLSCGWLRMGRTGPCLNVHREEPHIGVCDTAMDGLLAIHCKKRYLNPPCDPIFEQACFVPPSYKIVGFWQSSGRWSSMPLFMSTGKVSLKQGTLLNI